jgi:hypothetical protein
MSQACDQPSDFSLVLVRVLKKRGYEIGHIMPYSFKVDLGTYVDELQARFFLGEGVKTHTCLRPLLNRKR